MKIIKKGYKQTELGVILEYNTPRYSDNRLG